MKTTRETLGSALADTIRAMPAFKLVIRCGGTLKAQTHDGKWFQITVELEK